MINLSIASLVVLAVSVGLAKAGSIELYRVPGTLLTTADGKFAVRTSTRNQYSQPNGASVTVFDVATRNSLLQITSEQMLDMFPTTPFDDFSVSALHYGFGLSAAIAGQHILVGSPGTSWVCDCMVDPGIEVRGRPGRAFVFGIDESDPPMELDAPNFSKLTQEHLSSSAEENWLYFGAKVAAAGPIGLVNGRTFDLSTGKQLVRLGSADPYFDSTAINGSYALISHAWTQHIGVNDLLGHEVRTLIAPLTGDRNAHPIALEDNLALIGVPGPRFDPRVPGEVYLFNVETGEILKRFAAGSAGVVNRSGGDGFGRAVALRGNRVLIGAPYDSELGERSGAAYLFDIHTGELLEKILPTSREYPHGFGTNVGLTNSFALIEEISYIGREMVGVTSVYAIPEPGTADLAVLAFVFSWHAFSLHRIVEIRKEKRSQALRPL